MENTKFYTFNQNNSGGYFIDDDIAGLSEYVIIEALNAKEAWDKLCSVIDSSMEDAWSYCGCCGERWSNFIDDEDGNKEPCIYGEPLSEVKKGLFRKDATVHYSDGTFKKFELLD